jgi:hypothetical protein
MARLNLWTGVPKWSVDLRQSGPAELRTGFWQPGLISAGDVILARTPNQLVAIDRRGKIRWHVPILGEAGTVRPVLLADQVIVAVSRTKLASLQLVDGRALWSREITWPSWGLPVLVESEGKLAALVDCFELLGLDAKSGEPHWQARLTRHPSRRTQEVFSHAGPTVVSIDPEGIEARSIVDGQSRWRAAHQNLRSVHVVGPVVFGFASSGQEGTVLLWDLDRGDLLHEAVLPGVGAVPTVEWCSKGAVVKGDQRSVGFYWE